MKMYEVQMNSASSDELVALNEAYERTKEDLTAAYECWEMLAD